MDDLDQKIISLLRKNARISIAHLAQKLGVARGTVKHRIQNLEDQGIIVGYTVQLRPDATPDTIMAWMGITIDGNATIKVVNSLLGEPAVVAIHDTNGRWDLLAEIHASSLADLSDILERIRLIKHISNSETSIHLKSYR